MAVRDNPRRSPAIAVLIVSSLLVTTLLAWTLWDAGFGPRIRTRDRFADSWPHSPWKNARREVSYVGDAACARCHAEIAETYRRHPMGRSLTPIGDAPAIEGPEAGEGSIRFEAGGSRFTIERRDGRMVHREARLDEKGRVLAQVEAAVSYALGSGTRGVSYLVERDGRLFESPISWYSQARKWDISPGYRQGSAHFDRRIEPGCLFCHANRVQPVEQTANRYAEPIFRGHAIGCERCHGPGGLHIRHPGAADGADPTIVNPRHLEPALRVAVCEQCHVLGVQRVERPGRSLFDYRPGLATADFFAIFGRADERGHQAVDHVTQMRVSRCYRQSQGALDCTSCHDPHQVPAAGERVAYFRQRCLNCHESAGCRLPRPVRLSRSPADDCVRCHMPRARSADIAHTATTDHRIPRTPDAPPAGPAPPDPDLPLVLLNGGGMTAAGARSLDRELAIALAAEAPRMPATPRTGRTGALALEILDGVLANDPEDRVARRMKAMVLARTGRRAQAIREVETVLTEAPASEKALAECLSYAIDAGDLDAVRRHAARAVAVNPGSAFFQERRAFLSISDHDWDAALRESREAIRIDPFLRFARMSLIQSHLRRGEADRAGEEFATLIGLNPSIGADLRRWFENERRRSGK